MGAGQDGAGEHPAPAFVSYSHADRRRVTALLDDLRALHQPAWSDREVLPGQHWWDEICRRIHDGPFFVFALSAASSSSPACGLELAYAIALGKPVLPVLVGEPVPLPLVPGLAAIQYADLRGRRRRARATLRRSLDVIRREPPHTPSAEPLPPPPPIADLGDLPNRVRATGLSADGQQKVADELSALLADPLARDAALRLLGELARRADLDPTTRRRVEVLLHEVEDDEERRRLLFGLPLVRPGTTSNERAGLPGRRRPKSFGSRAAFLAAGAGLVVAAAGVGVAIAQPTEPETALAPSREALDLGSVNIGSVGAPVTVDFANLGARAIQIDAVSVAGALREEVRVAGCAGRQLAPHDACTVQLRFAPTAAGQRRGTLVASSTGGKVAVGLTGAGVGVGRLTAEPARLELGPERRGATATRTVVLRNTGTAGMVVDAVRLEGAAAGELVVQGCTGRELAPGESCQLKVAFTPRSPGERAATLSVVSGGRVATTVAVHGTVVDVPSLVVVPSSLDFADVVVGQRSRVKTVRVMNRGDAAAPLTSVSIWGEAARDYVVTGCATGVLEANTSCLLSVRFEPSESGPRWATLEVTEADGTGLVSLTGQGVGVTPVAVPDVVGLDEVTATARLAAHKLQARPSQESSDTVEAGRVIRTLPSAGGIVPEGSEVTVVVSSGPAQVPVPEVEGMGELAAVKVLTARGFLPRVVYYDVPSGSVEDGLVGYQNPAAGTPRVRGGTVTIEVARALPPSPPVE